MSRLKRTLTALLALALCAGLLAPASLAVDNVFFTSVNDTVLPLTSATMPVWSGGVLYVPYSVFDMGTTGIDLGVSCSYSKGAGTVTMFNTRKMLVFDLNRGTAYNELTGDSISAKAITRNGRAYVPVVAVCGFFGLTSSYQGIEQGYLVRIKSDAVVLNDDEFPAAASDLINRRLREYNQSLSGGSQPAPEPETPTTVPDPGPESSGAVYLGFRCDKADGLAQILDTLDRNRMVGVFFFTAEQLQRQDDLVRRIVASGHSLGLLAGGDTAEQVQQELRQGSRVLSQVAYTQTTLVMAPKAMWGQLEAAGWICWKQSVSAVPRAGAGAAAHAGSVLRALGSRYKRAYLTLDGGTDTARVLPTLLSQLKDQQFVVSIPLETRL